MPSSSVEQIVAAGAFVVVAGVSWVALARGSLRRWRVERWERRRSRQAENAALEASLEDEAFAPAEIRGIVNEILAVAEMLWSGRSPAVTARPDAPVIRVWAQSLAEGLGDGVRLVEVPSVDFLRVINRPGEGEDRVVLRIRLRLHREQRESLADPHTVTVDERWTLGRAAGRWTLRSVDSDPLAPAVLAGRLVPAEWADDDRLREQSLAELAQADTHPPDAELGELISVDAPADQKLRELSAMDARFVPELLSASLEHVIEAWEEATTGTEGPLAQLVSPTAMQVLLHPPTGDQRAGFVLRDATLERWKPTALDLATQPPCVEVSLTVSAVRYVVSSTSGSHLRGSVDVRHEMTLAWTLQLINSERTPWQLMTSTNPAEGIPGSDH